MAKKIKKRQPAGEQNQGRNRQERRGQQERVPLRSHSGKPIGMRIAIVVILLIMALGILMMPLLSAFGK